MRSIDGAARPPQACGHSEAVPSPSHGLPRLRPSSTGYGEGQGEWAFPQAQTRGETALSPAGSGEGDRQQPPLVRAGLELRVTGVADGAEISVAGVSLVAGAARGLSWAGENSPVASDTHLQQRKSFQRRAAPVA